MPGKRKKYIVRELVSRQVMYRSSRKDNAVVYVVAARLGDSPCKLYVRDKFGNEKEVEL